VRISRNAEHFVKIDLPPETGVVVTRSRNELNTFYRAAKVVVMPSRWFETFGVVAAEAMALGIPVIVSNLGAAAGLIDDGVEGLLFRAGDAVDLAAKMRQLWDDPAECARMGAAARRRALNLWNEKRHYRTLTAVYSSLAGLNAPLQ
jgi:glycosyltransferase involved in cell wall biosynthesis